VTQASAADVQRAAVVLATVAVPSLVHALRMLVMTDAEDLRFLLTFAFIPRVTTPIWVVGGSLPAALAPTSGPFSLRLHPRESPAYRPQSGLAAAVGTALARASGRGRYVAFMLVVAAAGALAHRQSSGSMCR